MEQRGGGQDRKTHAVSEPGSSHSDGAEAADDLRGEGGA